MRVGIIGCGNISETYFNCQNIYNNFKVIACSDIDIDFAKKSAEKFNVKAQSVEDLLSNPEIDLIINLTIPSAHKEVIINSLKAGKHCFSEKPLAMNFDEGKEIYELSKNNRGTQVINSLKSQANARRGKTKNLIFLINKKIKVKCKCSISTEIFNCEKYLYKI